MMQNQHPNIETLTHYADTPTAKEHRHVRQHLINCGACRSRVDQLTLLQQDIRKYIPRMNFSEHSPPADESLNEKMEMLIDGQLKNTPQAQISASIKNSKNVLKSALHYATHSAAMQRHLEKQAANPAATHTNGNRTALPQRIINIVGRYLKKQTPIWTTAPAAFALSALLTVITLPLLSKPTTAVGTIAVYQDNPTMSFKKGGLPNASIGFFGDANSMSVPYQGMKISPIPGGGIQFSWPPVDNAEQYALSLFQYSNNTKSLITDTSTQNTQHEFKALTLNNQHRYQWRLTGTTHDNQQFSSSGGFVYNTLDNTQP